MEYFQYDNISPLRLSALIVSKNNWSMDSRTYDMTDYHTSKSQVTSADILPNLKKTDGSITGAVNGLYDKSVSEESAAEEAVYSVLVDMAQLV